MGEGHTLHDTDARHQRSQLESSYEATSSMDCSIEEVTQYDRMLRFVEMNSTVSADALYSLDSLTDDVLDQQRWHHSYDEEAEEGVSDDETDSSLMLASASAPVNVYPSYPHSGDQNSIYNITYCASSSSSALALPASALPAAAEKQWYYSYDEEAEDSFEAASSSTSSSSTACAAVPSMVASPSGTYQPSIRETRYQARLRRAARRHNLHASFGDLERMQPWMEPLAAAKASQKYNSVLSFVEHNAVVPLTRFEDAIQHVLQQTDIQYRRPQWWQYTFDEDVHGSFDEASGAALSSA